MEALIDPAAGQRTLASRRTVSELFYERGILVDPKVNKDVFAGIAQVKSFLSPKSSSPNLYIFSNCTNMIREFKTYFWGSGDSPRKVDDHAMDELRYYLMSVPRRPVLRREEPTDVQKDKARRIRALRHSHTSF